MRRIFMTLAFSLAAAAAPAWAADDLAKGNYVKACIDAAAHAHSIPPEVLLILLNVENGRLGAVSQNTNDTVDIGPMQVNQIWVPKLAEHWRASREATYRALRDEFCANVEGGAWILRQALDEADGDLWEGIGLYHSHNERHKATYRRLVLAQGRRLQREAAAETGSTERDAAVTRGAR
ncbi:lytic transglycosylase domain-containing protein [Methylosinus sporium]|uniref:Lytic transglycosylase domain-containing protein n=1 Tax=Methylosinus sporium TaxID=428 RepID=A0A549SCU2_METSR|nr:lytic transglycosylase domain-containing protein [Methylosinus sporium]TRL23452.1 lytic transglycosylase domain-containing protein [Methylosinus sporium]